MEVKKRKTQRRREWSTGSDITEQSRKTGIDDMHYLVAGKLMMTLVRAISTEWWETKMCIVG